MNRLPEELPPHAMLARQIVGKAMKVHRALSCGFVESVYRGALAVELRLAGIEFEIHPVLPVFYEGEEVGVFQADIIIQNKLIVELKAVETLTVAHSVQLINYLNAAQIEHGLLLNFGTKSLHSKPRLAHLLPKSRPSILQICIPRKSHPNQILPFSLISLIPKIP